MFCRWSNGNYPFLTALDKIRVCVASHDWATNGARGKWSSQRRIGIAYSSASPSVVLAATSESIPSTVLDTNEATARPPAIKHPRPGSHSVGPLSCHAHRPHSIAAVPAISESALLAAAAMAAPVAAATGRSAYSPALRVQVPTYWCTTWILIRRSCRPACSFAFLSL